MNMKKRTAYIGIAYPLLYDYRHQAKKSFNDMWDSPNPIIESPLGLMIFYDEILFLCRSICPENMRNLPYVKFVDELYTDFCFENIKKSVEENEDTIINSRDLSYDVVKNALNIHWDGVDTHTHSLKIGDIKIGAQSNKETFLFDLYVFQALQELYDPNIELVTNSQYAIQSLNNGVKTEFIDKIIIPGVPNYIGYSGPYHECMEELRENKYLKDFRRWIIEEHGNIQISEITEMCEAVEKNIEEVKMNVFKQYLENNSGFLFFKSTAITTLKTVAGLVCSPVSVIDAFAGTIVEGKKALNAKSARWQGFVVDSRNIVRDICDVKIHK